MITITITSDKPVRDRNIVSRYIADVLVGLTKQCKLYVLLSSGEIVEQEIITKSSPLLIESPINIVDSNISTEEWRPYPGTIKEDE